LRNPKRFWGVPRSFLGSQEVL